MEVKAWTYEEFPEYEADVEGAAWLDTSGDEVAVCYLPDVVYAKTKEADLKLQILMPATRNQPNRTWPCIVFVEGSAWMKQNVYVQIPRLGELAKLGYVVAVVEYRSSDVAAFPAQIYDAQNAVRFLRKHAVTYHVQPDQMLLAGDSSGGHTAMFAGFLEESEAENLYPGISASVKGIVNYYGSTSVMAPDSNPCTVDHCLADSPEGKVMGHVDLTQEMKRALSVECNITKDTLIPPTLIFHGTKDRIVNCEGSVILYRHMKACEKDVILYLLRGADHGGPEFWTQEILHIVDEFIQRVIG